MSTANQQKLQKMEQDVALLRSAVIGLVKQDPEGAYRDEFISEIRGSLAESPEYVFPVPKTSSGR